MKDEGVVVYRSSYKVDMKKFNEHMPWLRFD